jgi:uncharacterized repeat protein (TIGR01451 family)
MSENIKINFVPREKKYKKIIQIAVLGIFVINMGMAGLITVIPGALADDSDPALNPCADDKVKIIKRVVGGTATSSDFTIHVGGIVSFPGSLYGSDIALEPGMYEISETGPEGYSVSFSEDCYASDCEKTGIINMDDTGDKICVITNNYICEENCGNWTLDPGEDCDLGAENGLVCEAGYGETCTYCSEQCQEEIITGEYCGDNEVNGSEECDGEAGVSEGWNCTDECVLVEKTCDSYCGDGKLDEPEEECDDGNNENGDGCDCDCKWENGSLFVKKVVVGGTAEAKNFKINIGDIKSYFATGEGRTFNLDAGMYQISESGNMDNYILSYSGDCSEAGMVSVVNGETKTCILTNTYYETPSQLGTLTVIKEVVGGTATSSDFTMQVGELVSFPGSLQGETRGIAPGTYDIRESSEIANYDLSYSLDCNASGTVEVLAGEPKICKLTNTYVAPLCGNSELDNEEECDLGESNGLVCEAVYGETCTYCSSNCEEITIKGPFCGDGTCNANETCSSCSTDCGSCGGGGGGGGLLIPTNRGTSVVEDTPTVKAEVGEPHLVVEKKVNMTFANAGDKGTVYTIVVANNGSMTAYETIMTDDLPDSFVFSGSAAGYQVWQLGDLAPGEIETFSLKVDIKPEAIAGIYTNTVQIQAENHDPVSASADIEVRTVTVKGISMDEERLVETGFSPVEFVALVVIVTSLFGMGWYVRRELSIKN